jgi:hypothetical protein
MWKLGTGANKPLTMNDLPILRRFVGDQSPSRSKGYYYDAREAIESTSQRVSRLTKLGHVERARTLRREHAAVLRMEPALKITEKRRKALQDRIDGASGDAHTRLEEQMLALMRRFNQRWVEVQVGQ